MENTQITYLRKILLDNSKPEEEREIARKELLKILESGDNESTNT